MSHGSDAGGFVQQAWALCSPRPHFAYTRAPILASGGGGRVRKNQKPDSGYKLGSYPSSSMDLLARKASLPRTPYPCRGKGMTYCGKSSCQIPIALRKLMRKF